MKTFKFGLLECVIDEIPGENLHEGDQDNRYVDFCDANFNKGIPLHPEKCIESACGFYRRLYIQNEPSEMDGIHIKEKKDGA